MKAKKISKKGKEKKIPVPFLVINCAELERNFVPKWANRPFGKHVY